MTDVDDPLRVLEATRAATAQYNARGFQTVHVHGANYQLIVKLNATKQPRLGEDAYYIDSVAREAARTLGLEADIEQPEQAAGGVLMMKIGFGRQTSEPKPIYSADRGMTFAPTGAGPPKDLIPEIRRRYGGCGEGCTYSD